MTLKGWGPTQLASILVAYHRTHQRKCAKVVRARSSVLLVTKQARTAPNVFEIDKDSSQER